MNTERDGVCNFMKEGFNSNSGTHFYDTPLGNDSTIYNPAVTPGILDSYKKPGTNSARSCNSIPDIKMPEELKLANNTLVIVTLSCQ